MKTALVTGSSGFIGGHLVKRLKEEGYFVVGADMVRPKYTQPDRFYQYDLRVQNLCSHIFIPNRFVERYDKIDEVYQLAADMGGAGYIFSGDNDANVMHNSAQINLNVADCARRFGVKKLFYSSSACMYPQELQQNPRIPSVKGLKETDAYPANPDSEYGWEKLFSERLFLSYHRNYDMQVRIARFHNIFGPEGTWTGGKEKAPAAICRKVAESTESIEVWGDGEQTRSFLYIDECIEGIRRLMESDFGLPINIGSDELISINDLAKMAMEIAGKELKIHHIPGPQGVRGRNSDNTMIQQTLGWRPSQPLRTGMEKLYFWIDKQVNVIL